jgi:hypothetical protein
LTRIACIKVAEGFLDACYFGLQMDKDAAMCGAKTPEDGRPVGAVEESCELGPSEWVGLI